ncbi:glycosyltransferase family 2 protein [Demequina sp.]|uniref:glycosyltransferase family 2 protein n=1 Tax=Demequina sp. TaxID=2050685 RepID=UPI003D0967B2
MRPSWSAVVLSQGTRPVELGAAVGSLLAQTGVALEVIVVGNGWEPSGLPDGVRTVYLETNLGAPKGRNKGIERVRGRLVFFLDDDAVLPEPDTLARIEALFAADPTLGAIQTRIETPDGESLRRWVPRLRNKDPMVSSEVFSVLEGSVAVRKRVLRGTRNWPGRFFYAHEGIELAWRTWDYGYRVEYRADLRAVHPRVERSRHADHMWQDARNRVWLAKRNLPCPIAIAYILDWAVLTTIRNVTHPRELCGWLRGAWAGITTDAGRRRPMAWKTVWAMTKRGRPPVL